MENPVQKMTTSALTNDPSRRTAPSAVRHATSPEGCEGRWQGGAVGEGHKGDQRRNDKAQGAIRRTRKDNMTTGPTNLRWT